MKTKLIYVGLFTLIWLIFQFAFVIGVHFQATSNQAQFLANIEKRIAIDLPKLRLANPKFKTVADTRSVSHYISDLNSVLDEQRSPIDVISIQGIVEADIQRAKASRETYLETHDQKITIQYAVNTPSIADYFGLAPLILATLLSYLCIQRLRLTHRNTANLQKELETPVNHQLIIDLKSKSISYVDGTTPIILPNKPFCFYAALVDYCIQDNSANLSNSSDVPEELIQMANKYFYRLIDLGHTKRKRPDFAANLDKTLSEIRSALDEIFVDHQEEKELYYPPKAQGEGSRSKLHNYALPHISAEKVLFIGK